MSELEALLRSQFPHVFFWGQRVGVGSFTYAMGRPASQSPSVLQALTIAGHDVLGAVGALGRPVYFLAVCSDTPLEAGAFGFDSVILEPADDLYAQLTAQIQHQNEVHREDQAQVDRLQLELETVKLRRMPPYPCWTAFKASWTNCAPRRGTACSGRY